MSEIPISKVYAAAAILLLGVLIRAWSWRGYDNSKKLRHDWEAKGLDEKEKNLYQAILKQRLVARAVFYLVCLLGIGESLNGYYVLDDPSGSKRLASLFLIIGLFAGYWFVSSRQHKKICRILGVRIKGYTDPRTLEKRILEIFSRIVALLGLLYLFFWDNFKWFS